LGDVPWARIQKWPSASIKPDNQGFESIGERTLGQRHVDILRKSLYRIYFRSTHKTVNQLKSKHSIYVVHAQMRTPFWQLYTKFFCIIKASGRSLVRGETSKVCWVT
jgi:hypothetical protein